MGLIGTALQIGRSALLSYQSALQIVGNNISNAGSDEYTRQSARLSPQMGSFLPEGMQAGSGVALVALQRNVDESVENRLRLGLSDQGTAMTQREAIGRLESVLNELSDYDLSTLLEQFFGSFSSLQNNPHDQSARGIVLTAGESLVNEIGRQSKDALTLVDEINKELVDLTTQVDRIASEVATLNVQIVEAESRASGQASALRDQRDSKLRELSGLIEVQVRAQDNGSINVYIGNEPLVQAGLARGLITETRIDADGIERVEVQYADTHGAIALLGGRIEGLVTSRDSHALGHMRDLDTLARALIHEVNKVHSQGQGLVGFTDVTSTNAVADVGAALNTAAAGLDLTPQTGSFQIWVTDTATGTSVATTIHVDLDGLNGDDTTLATLAAAIDGVDSVAATVQADRRVRISAANGYEITFGEDSSHVLAAMGINTFFTGRMATDIKVNPVLAADSRLLAAAKTNFAGDKPGDGDNAGAISEVGRQTTASLSGLSVVEFYNRVAGNVATNGYAARAAQSATDAIMASLQAQRESLSGVSLDEEALQLVRMERAFQGAARYVSVVDELINELLALAR